MAAMIVTGAAGFIGSHVVDTLLAGNNVVVGVDNFGSGTPENLADAIADERFILVEADVSAPWTWLSNLREDAGSPHTIYHLASFASPAFYRAFPFETLRANSLGTMNAVEAALRFNATLVYSSTSECYGDPLEHPQRETYWGNVNPIGPRACYDEGKRFAEAWISTAVREKKLDGRIARIFNTYGPRMRPDDGRVIPAFCISALRGEALPIFGDGSQTRSFCFVDDLVDGLVRLANRPGIAGEVVNLGNPVEITMLQLAALVCEAADKPLSVSSHPLPADDPARRRPDIEKARRLLEWQPSIPLGDGLARTLRYFAARTRSNAALTLNRPTPT